MQRFYARRSLVLLLAGAVAVGTLAFTGPHVPAPVQTSMAFWEAAGRGLVTVVSVNETVNESGHKFPAPAGILVTNAADVPVVIPEEAVLMSPHPSQTPPPDPLNTTVDAALTNGTVPAHGSLLYSSAQYVLRGILSGPIWWDLEEIPFAKAGIEFKVGGETLPFALRTLVEHPFYHGPSDDTQTALWMYLRSYPAVVVGKLPLYAKTDGSAGQTVRVRLDATNMAVWSTDDHITANVNVTQGIVEDDVPAGWTVEEGSFSVPPDLIVNHSDGSKTLEWYEDLPAPQVSNNDNPYLPTPYVNVTRFYTLVTPDLGNGSVELPRARSDMNRTGTPDAHSAPVVVMGNAPPVPDAGGPYVGNEGDMIVLNASKSSDPEGDPLQYRWSFTDNGTWDTAWSSVPTATVRYTDEFSGRARVQVTDGGSIVTATASVTIGNVPPAILSLSASTSAIADFRLVVAGEKYHDVALHLFANGTELANVRVVRQPGSPEDQARSTGLLSLNLTKPIFATVLYTPSDDPVNGRPNGDNPAWLVVTFANGSSVRWSHNFNVQHEATWNWSLGDLRRCLFPEGVRLQAHLFDPGADGLTARWDFGDGTNLTQVFPNGPADDVPEAVVGGAAPMDLVAAVVHAFPEGHDFTVTLTVTDADGASATATLVVSNS